MKATAMSRTQADVHAVDNAVDVAVDVDHPAAQVANGMRSLITAAIPSARGIELTDLVRSAGGLSRENWSFDGFSPGRRTIGSPGAGNESFVRIADASDVAAGVSRD